MSRRATGFDEQDARRVAAFTRGMEQGPEGRVPRRGWRPGLAVRRVVRTEDTTPNGLGIYPAWLQEFDTETAEWSDASEESDCWASDVNSQVPVVGSHRGLLAGESAGKPVFATFCCEPSCCPGFADPEHFYFTYSDWPAPFDFLNGTTDVLSKVPGFFGVYRGEVHDVELAEGWVLHVRAGVSCFNAAEGLFQAGGLSVWYTVPDGFCDPDQFTIAAVPCGTFGERANLGPSEGGGVCVWRVNYAFDFPTFPTSAIYVAFQCGGTRPIDVTDESVANYHIDISLITLPCLNCNANCPDGIVSQMIGTIRMTEFVP